jgi:hypothetical protein
MSDYETHKGTLKPTELTKEEVVYNYLRNYNGSGCYVLKDKKELEENNTLAKNTVDEYFYDVEQYTEVNGKIYEVQDNEFDGYIDIFEAFKNSDGTINYIVKFYNGGCSFDEALEEATSKL